MPLAFSFLFRIDFPPAPATPPLWPRAQAFVDPEAEAVALLRRLTPPATA